MVRYRIDRGFTDALGYLVAFDHGDVTVRTTKSDVIIAVSLVVAAKEVPPASERHRTRSVSSAPGKHRNGDGGDPIHP